jgi:hypothetical protein
VQIAGEELVAGRQIEGLVIDGAVVFGVVGLDDEGAHAAARLAAEVGSRDRRRSQTVAASQEGRAHGKKSGRQT